MITILDSQLNRLGNIPLIETAEHIEQLNGEYTVNFSGPLSLELNAMINSNTVFEVRGDIFDIAMFRREMTDSGTAILEVEAEHVSYRLNDLELEDFQMSGPANSILAMLLTGTGFTMGAVSVSTFLNFESAGEVTRRQLILQLATAANAELTFNRFTIGMVPQRGTRELKPIVRDKHVTVVSHEVDKRTRLPNGDYSITYDCQSLYLPGDEYQIGDSVRLMERRLSIWEDLRIVSIARNPYDSMDVRFSLANGPQEWIARGIERVLNNVNDRIEQIEQRPQQPWEPPPPPPDPEPGDGGDGRDAREFRVRDGIPEFMYRAEERNNDGNVTREAEWRRLSTNLSEVMFRIGGHGQLEFYNDVDANGIEVGWNHVAHGEVRFKKTEEGYYYSWNFDEEEWEPFSGGNIRIDEEGNLIIDGEEVTVTPPQTIVIEGGILIERWI